MTTPQNLPYYGPPNYGVPDYAPKVNAWQQATLINGFTSGTGLYYRRSFDGTRLEFTGQINNVTGGTLVCATVPAGFAPPTTRYGVIANSTAGTAVIVGILNTGDVRIFGAAAGAGVYLDGLSVAIDR